MRKTLEIIIFILISAILGFVISVPLFLLSTQDSQAIDFLGIHIENLNIYKVLVIFLVIVILIYFIISNIIKKFRQDENTRKYILNKYPPVISHILIFFSQIIPSLFPSWLRFLLIIFLILFIFPRVVGLWFTNTLLTEQKGDLINIIFSIFLTQLALSPIVVIFSLNKFFDRSRINEVDETSIKKTSNTSSVENKVINDDNIINDSKDIQANNENKTEQEKEIKNSKSKSTSIFLRRTLASFVDLLLTVLVIFIFVFIVQLLITNMIPNILEEEAIYQFILIISGIVGYFIINIIQVNLITNKGYSFGKFLTKLRIIDMNNNKLTNQKSINREIIFKVFGGMMYYTFIFFFFNKNGNMLHDTLLGTHVKTIKN